MSKLIDTILLTALPASGKSEVRRFLALQDAETVAHEYYMGPTVQLDDYPYVHMMRRISQECVDRKIEPPFFRSNDQPFLDARDWGTLIALSRSRCSAAVREHYRLRECALQLCLRERR